MAAISIEQRMTEEMLQCDDLFRQRGLSDVELLRRPAEVELVGENYRSPQPLCVDISHGPHRRTNFTDHTLQPLFDARSSVKRLPAEANVEAKIGVSVVRRNPNRKKW
jgi:hypothetical protein